MTGGYGISAGQQRCGDVTREAHLFWYNRQEGRDNWYKAPSRQAGGGLCSSWLWSGYKYVLQGATPVKEPSVDKVWREAWGSEARGIGHATLLFDGRPPERRQSAVFPGQEIGGKGTMRPVLGIETSCDETGVVLAEAVLSQLAEHSPFGGVVPEIAARTHLRYLSQQVRRTMAIAGVAFRDLGGVAATAGPGLIGGLIVGSQFGKGIAIAGNIPFVAVNHLEAHALTARLPGLVSGGAAFPYLLLLLSGGHSQCIAVRGVGQHLKLGGTVDDAVGEAFDKVAKLLGLGWPGGPVLERIATNGDPDSYKFPRPLLHRPGCDLSFSGLKTAVAQTVSRIGHDLSDAQLANVAASFQKAVVDVLVDRATHAMDMMVDRFSQADLLVVAGGVASNTSIRAGLAAAAAARGFRLAAPPIRLCTDNAVMVAWTGLERLKHGCRDALDTRACPRWPLEQLAAIAA